MPEAVSISITTELALLAACDLADDAAVRALVAKAGIDWHHFLRIAQGNGMAGLAFARISDLAPGVLPDDLVQQYVHLPKRNAIMQLAQTSVAVKLTSRLLAGGIRSIILKGMALNHMLYADNTHWRTSSDIDVLIESDDLFRADCILRDHGYFRQWPVDLPAKGGQDMFLLLANVFEYICPESGVLIELHHRITLNPYWLPASFDALHASAVDIETGQGTIKGLDGANLIAYLCWHAFAHLGFRLKWFCDIARAIKREGGASCASICPPSAGFASGPVALADALLQSILPTIEGREAAPPPPQWRKHVERIVTDMENPTDIPTSRDLSGLADEIAFRHFLARLSPGLGGKGYELLRMLSDPRDVEFLHLGVGFLPVYALLGPVLAIRRLILRQPGFAAH